MIKSHSIVVLLGVLMVCSAPAVAQATLIGDGVVSLGDDRYAATVGSSITVGVRANAGDMIAVLAAPLDKFGQPDYSAVVVLMVEENSRTGAITSDFQIPDSLAGMSFQLIGAALTVDGDISIDTAILTIVQIQDSSGV